MRLETLYYLASIGGTLRTGEVAEVLGITPAEVRRLGMLSDGLRSVNDGRKTRSYLARDVVAYRDNLKESRQAT